MKKITSLLKDQKGQGLMEYVAAVLLVAIVLSAVFGTTNPISQLVTDMFNRISNLINNL